ncbi:MAG TPA: LysE family translocator [Gaiellaceae bacterium]
MIDPGTYVVFVGAALALLVVPGPAVLYIVARSIHQGRAAGLASVLGIHVGTLVHILAATVGLSALVVSSATAFTVVKLLGAAYLVYLGIRTLLGRNGTVEAAPTGPARGRRRDFAEGIVVNVLNPKTALFFLAFLPQFVDPDAGRPALQILVLGLTFMGLGLVTDSLWALAAGTAGGWLRGHRGFVRAQRYVAGTVYIGLGAVTALTGPHRSGSG